MLHRYSDRLLDIARTMTIAAVVVVPFSTAATSIAIVIVILAWLCSGQALQTLQCSLRHPLGKMLVIFFLVLLLGCLYGDATWQERMDTLGSWRKFFYPLIFLGLFTAPVWQRRFLKSFLIVMSIALPLTFLAWFEIIPSRPGRLDGILANNHTTQSLAFVAAIVCCLYFIRKATLRWRFVLGILILLFAIDVLFVSTSRSGYLALMVGTGFAGLLVFGRNRIPLILALLLIVAGTGIFGSKALRSQIELGYHQVFNYRHNEEFTPMGARVVFWENTLQLIREKPVFGYGTGSFQREYTRHIEGKYSDWRTTPTGDPHNQYLYILVENGVFGLLVFLTLIVVTIRQGTVIQPHGVIAASVLAAWTATSLFNSHFKTFPEGHMLALFLGVLLAKQTERDAPLWKSLLKPFS